MGQKVFDELSHSNDFEFAGGVDRLSNGKIVNIELPERIKNKIYNNLFKIEKCDGVIDFSHPSALNGVLNFCLDRHVPLVLATTGLSEIDKQKVEFASRYIPIFMASNLSVGVQVLSDVVLTLTKKLKDYDIQIVETHHNKKVDAPSGTAKMLLNNIRNVEKVQNKNNFVKRKIDVFSLRGGGVVGEHEIKFLGKYDEIKITHTAFSRDIFAKGAMSAMMFLKNKTKGLYSMQDLT